MGKLETYIYNGLEEISDQKISSAHHYDHRTSATSVNELSLLDYELEEIKQLITTNDVSNNIHNEIKHLITTNDTSNNIHNETNLFFTDPIDMRSGKPQERSPAMYYRL